MEKTHPEPEQPERESADSQPPRSAHDQDRDVLKELESRSRRGFLVAGASALASFAMWRWLQGQPPLNGIGAPYRKGMDFNGKLSRELYRPGAMAPEFSKSKAVAEFRRNGDIGLSEIAEDDWRLQVVGVANPQSYPQYTTDVATWKYGMGEGSRSLTSVPVQEQEPRTHEQDAKGSAVKMKPMEMPARTNGKSGLLLTMADIRKLPLCEMVTEFKCIEGWSEIVHWGGVRLHDFLAAYPPPTKSGVPFTQQDRTQDIPEYVGLVTPDGKYFVGIEREVALHPQTLLAYELNGKPLTADHGAPLRLVTTLKYGIKQLKQIGRITYADVRPRDYWYEQGYDYYAGF
jgi:DMSO/TMAO reductase YedYZ molybdopterin-dependent catalytic subunit